MEKTSHDVLRALFEGEYAPIANYYPMTEEESAVWDKAQAILGAEMIDVVCTDSLFGRSAI